MKESSDCQVFEDAGRLVRAATAGILAHAREAVQERGVFHIALAGGSTPREVYARLAHEPEGTFDRWHAWFGDERCVPTEHADSNYRMASEAGLLARIPHVHRLRGEAADPHLEALRYQNELLQVLGSPPRLDLALLGLGADGHTASLFPGTEALEAPCLVSVGRAPYPPEARLTLTLPMLREARSVLFLVSGASKSEALLRVRSGDRSAPAERLRLRDGRLAWLVDRAAWAPAPGES